VGKLARRPRLRQAASGSSLPDLLRILLSSGAVAFIAVWYPVKLSDKRVQVKQVKAGALAAFCPAPRADGGGIVLRWSYERAEPGSRPQASSCGHGPWRPVGRGVGIALVGLRPLAP
jgi:hypothetical protein